MSDLTDELETISGVGPKTAEKVEAIVNSGEYVTHDELMDEMVAQNVREAYDHYEDGQYEYAGKYIRRAYNALEGE